MEKTIGKGKKHTRYDFKDFLAKKNVKATDIVYVAKAGGCGCGVIIDGSLYDIEAISAKIEEDI